MKIYIIVILFFNCIIPNRIRISLCRTAKRNPLIFPI